MGTCTFLVCADQNDSDFKLKAHRYLLFGLLLALGLLSCQRNHQSELYLPEKNASEDISFIAIGDTGTGDNNQLRVATAIHSWCQRAGTNCDFALYLGDNFYDNGLPNDPVAREKMWLERFGQPYFGLNFPFYVVMGNHDYSFQGIGNPDWKKVENYRFFHQKSAPGDVFAQRWQFPGPWYHFSLGNAMFMGLDTERLIYGQNTQEQRDLVDLALQEAKNKDLAYNFVFGHHPIYSNGEHGNAGSYGYGLKKVLEQRDGRALWDFYSAKTSFGSPLCQSVSIYINGHEHNLQAIHKDDYQPCPGLYIVSGSGGKVTNLHKTKADDLESETLWQSAQLGFVHIKISGSKIHLTMVSDQANQLAAIDCVKAFPNSPYLDCGLAP